MGRTRLEAFSDGVIAIIITIMVLELKVPHEDDLATLYPLIPKFFSYILSFVFVGIYWSNHHHTLHTVRSVNGSILWANLHLLFWLSLVPFVTGWMGENFFSQSSVAVYGVVMLMAAIAYYILIRALISHHGSDSQLAAVVGNDLKGKASLVAYVAAIGLSFVNPWISVGLYVLVAVTWFIPDRRMEKAVQH